MTNQEQAILRILKEMNLDMNTAIWIMLRLKGNNCGQNLLIEYLKTINPNKITRTKILDKVEQIAIKN